MSFPVTFPAGPLEEGQTCPCCQETIRTGEGVGRCPACGHVQHEGCWQRAGACCSYECASPTAEPSEPDLVLSSREVEKAKPLPVPIQPHPVVASFVASGPKRMSRLALVALVFALLGIPLFGLPGLVAIGLGAIAIGGINARRNLRGTRIAAAAIIVGVLTVLGWGAVVSRELLSGYFHPFEGKIPFTPPLRDYVEPKDLADTPAPIRRAIRANVLIVSRSGMQTCEGSGVVLEERPSQALIVTNRHVIDGTDGGLVSSGRIQVTFSDGSQGQATVVWRAPDGVDMVVVTCPAEGAGHEAAPVRLSPELAIGETVFAIGNPVGLGWSYSKGVISAIRKLPSGVGLLRMIQTQTPLNPGNSGGGLYDERGALIGINTMTMDKHRAEGIGFAIAIADLVILLEEKAGLKLQKARAGGGRGGTL